MRSEGVRRSSIDVRSEQVRSVAESADRPAAGAQRLLSATFAFRAARRAPSECRAGRFLCDVSSSPALSSL